MAEKAQDETYGHARVDEGAASATSKELRRKKRMKCLIYIVAFAVFQTGIILLFAFTVMKIKNPKFRIRSATFENFTVVPATPSFNLRMNAELGVKNTNFGHFKYQNSTVYFFYRGTQVGEAIVPKARARFRSTKKFNVMVDLSSANIPSNLQLGRDLNSGLLTFTSQSRLKGKVVLMMLMKKKKGTDMDCSMEVDIAKKQLQNVKCK